MEQHHRIMEEREELMVSPTGDGKPTLRMAHFLNPSLSSNDNPLHTPSPLSLSSKTSETQTQENPLNVSFKGWRNPQRKWKNWVDHMCSLHKSVWEKAGIYYSIMGSVYSIKKDYELVIKFAERWCPETKSFAFGFGEATITLEDMMTLGGYSVLGDSVLTPLPIDRASEETREELLQARLELVRTRARKANQGAWMKKFMKSGSRIEHEAFLSLWLSKFVFPSAAGNDSVGNKVLPIAIHLAQGLDLGEIPCVGTESKSPGIRCVRISELVGLDCIEEYFPHRVARQFGMDQDIPRKVVFCPKGNPEMAWQHYSRPISDAKLYIPPRCLNSHVTTRYLEWWTKPDGTKGVVKVENDNDSSFPPGFPPKRVGKTANIFPPVPPGFSPNWTIKTEDDVPADFPSNPPGFPPRLASNPGNNESSATLPLSDFPTKMEG
ncbi:hypothetical protein RHMOL_Rhmol09G0025700 [Rhododendron molle]|uniref:Uncharacterized protein n=1 Tax=Rhododendron molle TaxID=49168 RepID=A0ACC0MA55_RHOML|nr:hypothetical protein RHMOL_Rhmol09G0025700 [Rhododendron molle]